MACAGLLLTGGSSRRLGVDKNEVRLHGERLVDRAARALVAVCLPVLEVGPGRSGLVAVREDPPGEGPLAALVAGAAGLGDLGVTATSPVIALAVDMPLVDETLLAWLAAHPAPGTVVPIVDGQPQMLCARYGIDALERAPPLVAGGARSLRALLEIVPVHEAGSEEWGAVATAASFADVDTPADAARLGIELPG